MMPPDQRAIALACERCGVVLEICAFCERDVCGHPICYRCLRLQLGQSMAHPHVHGG